MPHKQIQIIWNSDENLPALYANQLFVSHAGESEFHIVFGHLSPPLTVAFKEEELPDSIKIKPVAKIIVSPETMKRFVEAFKENLEKFEMRQKEKKND